MLFPALEEFNAFVATKTTIFLLTPAEATLDILAASLVLSEILTQQEKKGAIVYPGHTSWPEPLQMVCPSQPIIPAHQLTSANETGFVALGWEHAPEITSLADGDVAWLPQAQVHSIGVAQEQGSLGLCAEIAYWMQANALTWNTSMAHNLLTGLISQTNGFRATNVDSGALKLASALIDAGADRQAIMYRLWRVQPVSTLQRWGAALERLVIQEECKLASTIFLAADTATTSSTPEGPKTLGAFLLERSPEINLALLINAAPTPPQAHLFTRSPLRADQLAAPLGGQGNPTEAQWDLEAGDPVAHQHSIITHLRHQLAFSPTSARPL